MKNSIVSVLIVLNLLTLSANSQIAINIHKEESPQEMDVPYSIAKGYFVKNTFTKDYINSPQIKTKKAFDAIFGMATVMGPDGKPTEINFKTHYVIAVTEKLSEYDIQINPLSLKKKGSKITLQCKIETGAKQTALMKPLLLLIVDKKYKGKVEVFSTNITAIPSQSISGLPLAKTQWIIESFNEKNTPVTTKDCFITINADLKSFTGKTGCNLTNGQVKIENNSISFFNSISTQMACDNMAQEQLFNKCLAETTHYKIIGGELFLYKNDQLLMTLESFR